MKIRNYFNTKTELERKYRTKIGIKIRNFFCKTEFYYHRVSCSNSEGQQGTASLTNKFSFLANKLQAATSGTTLSSANNQETVQGQLNRYIPELTEVNLDIGNWIKFWLQRMTTYKLTGPLTLDMSAPASQAFVERIFSLCSLMTAGRRNQMAKSLEMRAFLKLNKRLLE